MAVSDLSMDTTERIQRAAEDHLARRVAEAKTLLQEIDVDGLRQHRAAVLASIPPNCQSSPTIANPRVSIPFREQLDIFRRDHFICRYCGKWTIFAPTMRILSLLYPDVFLYHPHWDLGQGHLIYWTHSASCEHVVPVARGGTSDPENVVTACYLCNDAKGICLIEELGWELKPPSARYWNGLSDLYRRLWSACPEAQSNTALANWQKLL